MGKGTATSGEFVARKGFKRELQFALKSQSEICGGESLGRTRGSTINLNVESIYMEGKKSICGSGLKGEIMMERGLVYAKRRKTTSMSNLIEDLIADILSRIPITSLGSVRSTCKKWNGLSRNRIFGIVGEVKNQFLGFMLMDSMIYSLRIDFQGIRYDGNDFIDISIKHVSVLNQIEMIEVYHCDGLLLCVVHDKSRLLVWNPYLGQMRWIQHQFHRYNSFFLGYDVNRNHKILEIAEFGYEIYEFSSNSWRVFDVTLDWTIPNYPHGRTLSHTRGETLKGNAYFCAKDKKINEHFLLCFDFTSERFGPRLHLPFHGGRKTLSRLRDQLMVLYQHRFPEILEIWVTKKINYTEVLWTKFLQVDRNLFPDFCFSSFRGSFIIDVEHKVAVVFNQHYEGVVFNRPFENQTAHIIGQNGYFKSINIRGDPFELLESCSSYIPSLVQIE